MPKIDAKKVTMNMPMAPNADVLAASGSSSPPTKKDCVERRTPTQSCVTCDGEWIDCSGGEREDTNKACINYKPIQFDQDEETLGQYLHRIPSLLANYPLVPGHGGVRNNKNTSNPSTTPFPL